MYTLRLVFLALLAALLVTSCAAIAGAVGSFIGGVFWLAMTIASLVLWILYIFYDRTDMKERKRRWEKTVAQNERNIIEFFDLFAHGALWVSLIAMIVFVFSFSRLVHAAPRPLLVIVTLVQAGVMIVKWQTIKIRPFYVWLAAAAMLFFIFRIAGLAGLELGDAPFTIGSWMLLLAAGLLALIPALIVNAPLRAEQKRIEKIERDKKEAAEAAVRAEQERWKNLSLRDKIAELNSASLKKQKENDAALRDAQQQHAQAKANLGKGDPEKLMWEYMREAGSALSFQWRDFVSGSGVDEARVYVAGVEEVARFFASRYCVAVCQARQEDERLTVNRKKTIAYAEQLTEIWDKLTEKQKKRKISSAADSLKIGSVNVKIPDSLKSIDKLAVTYKDGNTEKLLGALGSYGDFRKQINLGSETANVGVFLATLIGTGLLNNFSANQDLKKKLGNKMMRLYKKIEKIRKAEPEVQAFTARAYEINMALDKAMQAYARMFNDVYRLLYPADDAEKSKEARAQRKKAGGDYFSAEESEAVLQLFTTGKFLLQIVDTKFEGEEEEKGDNDGE